MVEYFKFNGLEYGAGTKIKYLPKNGGGETTGIVIRFEEFLSRTEVVIADSVEDYLNYRYESVDIKVFEKFVVKGILGVDNSIDFRTLASEEGVEKTRKQWKEEIDKKRETDAAKQRQSFEAVKKSLMPPKPKFSRLFLTYLIISTIILLILPSLGPGGAYQEEIDAAFELIFMLDIIPLVLYYVFSYRVKLAEYNLAQTNFTEYLRRKVAEYNATLKENQEKLDSLSKEYEAAMASQKLTAPWATRYSTSPCPYCGHYKVRYAKWEDKRASVAFWGAASSKLGTNYKCEHCGRMWA